MRRPALRAVVIAALLAAPVCAHAQPGKHAAKRPQTEEAKLKEGIALVEAGDYDKAVEKLESIYASTHEPRALFWMGRALQQAGNNAAALAAFNRFVRESGKGMDEARVEALGNVQTLTMLLGVVTVKAPVGCVVGVDGAALGKAPLPEGIYLDGGKHTITSTCGDVVTSREVDVKEESRQVVDLTAKSKLAKGEPAAAAAESAPEAAAAPDAAPADQGSASSTSKVSLIKVSGLAGAGLLAVGSVFFGIRAAGSASDFDDKRGQLGVSRAELEDLQGETRLNAGLSLGLGLAGIGLAGVTLFVLAPRGEKASAGVTVSGRGVILGGSF